MKTGQCRTAKEFGDVFRAEVKRRSGNSWRWKKDLKPWLSDALNGAKFGNPQLDWSRQAAEELARAFISEASTW